MKIIVTGAAGFVGRYATEEFIAFGHEVVAVDRYDIQQIMAESKSGHITRRKCDVTQIASVFKLIEDEKPDAILHLAGTSHVVEAAIDVSRLVNANCLSVKYFCEAINRFSSKEVLFLLASTGLVYGTCPNQNSTNSLIAANECTPVNPNSSYARSKLAAEFLLETYAGTKVQGFIARPFNHTGFGQSPQFACPSFAVKIRESLDGVIKVGNLDAKRDFSDVRDIVRAYRMILEKRPSSHRFVLGSGRTFQIREVIEKLISISGKHVKPIVDDNLLRKNEFGAIYADFSLAKALLGWLPEYSLQETLSFLYFGPRGINTIRKSMIHETWKR